MRRSVPVVVAVLVVAFVVAALALVSAESLRDTESPLIAADASPSAPLRAAVVGDSLSAGHSRFLGNGFDEDSWMTYAVGDGIQFAGGWARAGATPEQMADAVRPVERVDVLVVLAGTNAVLHGETVADTADSYDRIAEVIHPDRVLVAAIPPYRAHAAEALAYNRDLRVLTRERGWTWVDPWTAARDGDAWAPGFSADGIHPAGPQQYAVLGHAFRQLILEHRPSTALADS
ncbi:SGNH/GDSL hydrolase family protein [Curtobacterium flaccumfaciens]|uniref:SGNH/GDSL hydrolase family protein n=1 Tax=Curtobacterium flaccumfaciens TaxID=2035 RepID=UPI00343D1832